MLAVLTRIYGKAALEDHAYSRTLSSLAFAGTIVGMLLFGNVHFLCLLRGGRADKQLPKLKGYLSDKIGRKFGMVEAQIRSAVLLQLLTSIRCLPLLSSSYSLAYLLLHLERTGVLEGCWPCSAP